MKYLNDYELVCGLEVHAELKTASKIFCSCPTKFGAEPNTQCCPVCSGMPGALPVLNRQVVELAVRAGLALNCEISRLSREDRKNYFYPDLPKAYQISQFDRPLCERGFVDVETGSGKKRIGVTRIHIEEDAGKLIHDHEKGTLIDLNRCGVPLIEIVSEPDIRSPEEASGYVRKLRSILLCAGVSDCKMNEGSLRCDVNLSVRKRGEERLGTRTEMKNLNSFSFIEKAIEYEYRRQVELIESGGRVLQETRRFDPASGKTFTMRVKENADDYRYFPDPDLPPIILTGGEIERIRRGLPKLPDERRADYTERLGLTAKDAEQIVSDPAVADYFEAAAKLTTYPKILANLLLGELFSLLPAGEDIAIPIAPDKLAPISEMSGSGRINSTTAKKLVRMLCDSPDADPEAIVRERGLEQIRDEALLRGYVDEALAADPKAVESYRAGKLSAAKAIMGRIMAKTGGRGDPVILDRLLSEALKNG